MLLPILHCIKFVILTAGQSFYFLYDEEVEDDNFNRWQKDSQCGPRFPLYRLLTTVHVDIAGYM